MISDRPSVYALASVLALTGFAQVGCKNTEIATENDALRRQVLDLQEANKQLKQRETELTSELARASETPDSLSPEIRENIPHVTEIKLGRLSHARDSDDDGVPDQILIYVNPVDGYGRFVQMVGHLSVHAAMLPADRDAVTIGRMTLDPGQLREAYRSGVTGTHYTIALPIDPASEASESSCLVRVRFEDGRTGQSRTSEMEIALKR